MVFSTRFENLFDDGLVNSPIPCSDLETLVFKKALCSNAWDIDSELDVLLTTSLLLREALLWAGKEKGTGIFMGPI
jgi:hypothetical protein